MPLPRAIPFLIVSILGGCTLWQAPPPAAPVPPPALERNASLPPLPVPPPEQRPLDPRRLVGLTQPQVEQLLGSPAAVREQPPALVWSYASTGCGLDLFFYLDLTSQIYKALTYDIKARKPEGLQGGSCLASLRISQSSTAKP